MKCFSPKRMVFAFLLAGLSMLAGLSAQAKVFKVSDVGVSFDAPLGWERNKTDKFGFVIHDPRTRNKIRIHAVSYPDIKTPLTPAEAVLISHKRIIAKAKDRPEKILSSLPVETASGISGQRVRILNWGCEKPYLDRYYFQKPDGTFFCVCVYFFGDFSVAEVCKKQIIDTLRLTSARPPAK